MPGTNATNLHIGSRSEMLADYFFGTFGLVTPVRLHDDYGLDLYCTLSERVGKRMLARESFSVQVKSTRDSWVFADEDEVRWLLEHTTPILLCVVNKMDGVVEVFHTFGRFAVPVHRPPAKLVLIPGVGDQGTFCTWNEAGELNLSAPIIRASVTEFYDDTKRQEFRVILQTWLRYERENLDKRRMGITRYRMPDPYTTNQANFSSIRESGLYVQNAEDVALGIRWLAEAVDCVGDQLRFLRDINMGIRAALLLDHLSTHYPHLLNDTLRQKHYRGSLVTDIARRLRTAGDDSSADGLASLQDELDKSPRVAAAIEKLNWDVFDPFSLAPRKS